MCCTQETEGNKLWYIANDFTSGMPSLRAIFKILFSGGMRVFVSVKYCNGLRRVRHKPKMTVVLTKSARFDETIMAEGAHGSYANDDEDTYEDADYSDAAFQDPRVPDVGEGDMNQVQPIA